MVQTNMNILSIFDKNLTPFWETFVKVKLFSNAKLLRTIIFYCSKNYGTPTLVTRLKVAPHMTDPISVNENLP